MAVCGNHLLEFGEQCTDTALGVVGDESGVSCEQECVPQACTADTERATFAISLGLPPAATANSVTVFVAYRSDTLSIPGNGLAPSVRGRVAAQIAGATFFPNDRDYALRLVLSSSSVFPSPALANVTFDVCSAAGTASDTDVTCFIEGCAGPGGAIDDCTCAAALLPQ